LVRRAEPALHIASTLLRNKGGSDRLVCSIRLAQLMAWVEEELALRTAKRLCRLIMCVVAVVDTVATGSVALSQSRIGPGTPLDVDLGSQELDLSEPVGATGAVASRPQDKTANAPLPLKPSPRDVKLEWVGIGSVVDGPDAKGDAGPTASNLGVKLKVAPPIMFGVLAEFDRPAETSPGSRPVAEQSWLAAATSSVQVLPGLSLDTRTAWGASEFDTSHLGPRRLVDVRLSQKDVLGAWRFSPSVGVNYVEERRVAALAIPDMQGNQTTGSGRVDVRPELAYRFDLQNSMFIEPKAMIGGFWDIGAPSVAGADARAQMRMKGEASVTIGNTQGGKVEIGGAVEEGAEHAPDVWSGRLQLSVPLK
jgi:hypothetical protein